MNFYGDNTRWFVGKIVDWEDDGTGRVKVRIIGLHSENVSNDDLPWAKCVLPTTEGGTSGIGKIPQMLNTAFVFGFFLDGSTSQMPVILGSMNQEEIPSTVQKNRFGIVSDQIVQGIPLDPDLEVMYDGGKANLETRAVIAMQFLIDAGMTDEKAAAGVVGNLIAESNLDPEAVGGLKEEGIAQWNPAVKRLDQLKEYQVKYFKNRSYKDFFVQLNFLVYDMKNNSAHRVWPVLTDTSISHEFKVDVPFDQQQDTNATYYFLKEYEVPEDLESKLTLRQEKAEEAYDFYQESKRVTTQYLVSAGAG
jgi:hypothetical protein